MNRFASITLALLVASCASDEHALRGGDGPHAWNFSPHASISAPDRALNACCPRGGGDMRIDAVVDGQGRMKDISIKRPPAPLGVLMSSTCVLFRGFTAITLLDADYDRGEEDKQMLRECDEMEQRMGGAFVPPPIPGTTQMCVERMSTSWALRDYAARPVSITWECRD
jgi:hypothetical protein